MTRKGRADSGKAIQMDLFGTMAVPEGNPLHAHPLPDAAEPQPVARKPSADGTGAPARGRRALRSLEVEPPRPDPEPPSDQTDDPNAVAAAPVVTDAGLRDSGVVERPPSKDPAATETQAVAPPLPAVTILDGLHERLRAIPADAVRDSHAILRFAPLEYDFIVARAKAPIHADALRRVGYDPARIDQIALVARACGEALRARRAGFAPAAGEEIRALRARAEALLRRARAAARFHLDPTTFAQASPIFTDEADVGSLVSLRLKELVALLRMHAAAFGSDAQFDPFSCAAEAEALALQLLEADADRHEDRRASNESDVEDRAFTLLELLVDELRRALDYAWADDPERVTDVFKPAMGRRRKARSARTESE